MSRGGGARPRPTRWPGPFLPGAVAAGRLSVACPHPARTQGHRRAVGPCRAGPCGARTTSRPSFPLRDRAGHDVQPPAEVMHGQIALRRSRIRPRLESENQLRGVAVTRAHRCEGGISNEIARGHGDKVFAGANFATSGHMRSSSLNSSPSRLKRSVGGGGEAPARTAWSQRCSATGPMSFAPAPSNHSSKEARGGAGAEWKCSELQRGQPGLRHGRAPDLQRTRIKRHALQEHCGCRRLHISRLSARRCCRALINCRAKRPHGAPALSAFAFFV